MTFCGFLSFLLLLLAAVSVSIVFPRSTHSAGKDPLALEWPWVSVEEDYESFPYPQSPGGGDIVQWSLAASVPSTSRNYTIHVGSLSSGLPNTFSFQLPEGGG